MRKLLFTWLMLLPTLAAAADMEYVVYDAFDETVMAFQRLALITSDPVFVMIAGCFMAASIVMAAAYFSAQGTAKQANNPMSMLIPLAVGLALFFGAVVPKGRIFVYDATLNKNQAVGDIPELIVFFAGALNAVEREVTRVVDTASANPYGTDVGASGFSLIFANATVSQADADLERTIGQYIMDCGFTAAGTGQNGANMNELLRSSDDLRDTLAKYTHPSWPTTYYPSNNSGGVPGSCQDSWDYLRPILDNVSGGQVADLFRRTCAEAGFDTTDAAQNTRCETMQLEAAKLFGVAPSNSGVFLRNFVIARGIQNMLQRPDLTPAQGALVNRAMIAEGVGASEASGQWVPRIRAMMLGIVLGIIPIVLLFVATNLVYKAIGLVVGLLVFMTMWGICDAVSVQMARDVAAQAFETIRAQRMGFESMMLAPTASLKALALYGKYRMAAMGIAGVICTALFKISAGAFNTAEVAGGDVASKGGQAGVGTMTSEGMQRTMSSSLNSTSAVAQVSTVGAGTAMSAAARNGMIEGREQGHYVESAIATGGRAGEGLDNLYGGSAAKAAGARMGQVDALGAVAGQLGTSSVGAARRTAHDADVDSSMKSIGSMEGNQRIARAEGSTPAAVISAAASAGAADNTMKAIEGQRSSQALFGAPDGDIARSQVDARKAAAGSYADQRVASKMQGDTPTAQMGNFAIQQNASQSGLASATGGDPTRAEGMYETGHTMELARNQTIAGSSTGAKNVGVAQGRDAIVGAEGTNRTVAAHGMDDMIQGNVLSKSQSAGAGDAAAKLGGAASVGHRIGTQSTVSNLANAEVRQSAARQIAGDGLQNQLAFEKMANGNLQATLSGPALDRFLDNAQRNGMSADTAAGIRRKGAARAEFSFDQNRGVVAATLSGQFRTQTGSFAMDENGSVSSYRNDEIVSQTSTRSYGPQLNGSTGLFNDTSALSNEVLRAYSGNVLAGAKHDANYDSLAKTLGEGMAARGYTASAANTDTRGYSWNAGGNISLGLGGSRSGAGLSAGGQASGGTTDAAEVRHNLNTVAFRDSISEARSQAVAEWSQRTPGEPLNVHDPVANQFVAERTAQLIQQRASAVEGAAERSATRSTAMNDALANSREAPPPDPGMPTGWATGGGMAPPR